MHQICGNEKKQVTENLPQTQIIMWKPKWEKATHREKFHYDNGGYNGVIWRAKISGLNWSSPSMLEGIYYLYK